MNLITGERIEGAVPEATIDRSAEAATEVDTKREIIRVLPRRIIGRGIIDFSLLIDTEDLKIDRGGDMDFILVGINGLERIDGIREEGCRRRLRAIRPLKAEDR